MDKTKTCIFILTFFLFAYSFIGKAEDNKNAKFKISVNGGFDYSQSKLTSSSSIITDIEGEVQSDQSVDNEGLKSLNAANAYKLEQQFIDVRAEYLFLKRASIWAGVGVVTTSMRNSYTSENKIHTKSASENPVFLLKGGLSYQYDFKGDWFMKVVPQIAWNQSNNNLMTFAENGESAVYHSYDLRRDVLRWEIPVIAGKSFGKWTLYLGLSYCDYLLNDRFYSTVSFIGKDYPIKINDKYHMSTKIAGIAGCSYSIYENLGVNLNLRFSRDIAGNLSLYFTL